MVHAPSRGVARPRYQTLHTPGGPRDPGRVAHQGHAHHYFHRDHYYRLRGGHWEVSVDWNGGWTRIEVSALPASLAKHTRKQAKKKRKGHYPAKHR